MSDIKKAKRDVTKLLSRWLGIKLEDLKIEGVVLNTEYDRYQLIEQLMKICKLEKNEFIQSALQNTANRGLNRALRGTSEITQLGAYIYNLIPEKETIEGGKKQIYDESEPY